MYPQPPPSQFQQGSSQQPPLQGTAYAYPSLQAGGAQQPSSGATSFQSGQQAVQSQPGQQAIQAQPGQQVAPPPGYQATQFQPQPGQQAAQPQAAQPAASIQPGLQAAPFQPDQGATGTQPGTLQQSQQQPIQQAHSESLQQTQPQPHEQRPPQPRQGTQAIPLQQAASSAVQPGTTQQPLEGAGLQGRQEQLQSPLLGQLQPTPAVQPQPLQESASQTAGYGAQPLEAEGVAQPSTTGQPPGVAGQPSQQPAGAAAAAGGQVTGQPSSQLPSQTGSFVEPTAAGRSLQPGLGEPEGTFVPQVDVWDAPDEVLVLVDLPGCGPDDVELQATDNSLHVVATRAAEETDEAGRAFQRERLDRAERRLDLPSNVDVERAEATCEDGVCRIRLPKREEDQQQRIGIH